MCSLFKKFKKFASILRCTINKLNNGSIEIKNELLCIKLNFNDMQLSNCEISYYDEPFIQSDILKILFNEGYLEQLGRSIKFLLSTLTNCSNKLIMQKKLSLLELKLGKLYNESASNSVEKFSLEFLFFKTEIRPFSIILFCDSILINAINKCIDPIAKYGDKFYFAYFYTEKTSTFNELFEKNSNDFFCPFNFCLRFSQPILLLKSSLKAIEFCGNFKCIVSNATSYKNFTYCLQGIKFKLINDNLLEFFYTQEFDNVINEALFVDEIKFTTSERLVQNLSIIREQLIFNFLIKNLYEQNEEYKFYQFIDDKKISSINFKYIQVYLIPVMDLFKFGLIVSFKIGGVTLSVKILIYHNSFKLKIMSKSKLNISNNKLSKWASCLKKYYSIPILIQSILLELEKSPKDFGCLFTLPMLPTINVADKLIDTFILNHKFDNSKIFIDFDINENSFKINSKKLKKKSENRKYKDFNNIKSFGESWKELVFFYFFIINRNKNKNELINNYKHYDEDLYFSDTNDKISKKKSFNKLINFNVEHENKHSMSLLRSKKYTEEVSELVPRRPPYQNKPYYNQFYHYHVLNQRMQHHSAHISNSKQFYTQNLQSFFHQNSVFYNQQLTRSLTLNSIILPKENLKNSDSATSNSLSEQSLIYDSASSINNCQIRNSDSNNSTMTLNNAISDLEALAAMGRDDSESMISDCNRFGAENSSQSNLPFKDLSQDQRNRFQQTSTSIINSNQLTSIDEHNHYRMMQQLTNKNDSYNSTTNEQLILNKHQLNISEFICDNKFSINSSQNNNSLSNINQHVNGNVLINTQTIFQKEIDTCSALIPSEESRRIYEMEMLEDSSDDDETDPPPPRSLDSQSISLSNLTTQQAQQRNQRAAAAAEQQRKSSVVSNSMTITSSSNLLPKHSLSKAIVSITSSNDSNSTNSRLISSIEETEQNKSTINYNNDVKKNDFFVNDIKLSSLQKLNNLEESNINTYKKLSLQFNQIKKETPPALDLYDSELKSDSDIKIDLKNSTQRFLINSTSSENSIQARIKDSSKSLNSKDSLRRKTSYSVGTVNNKRDNSSKINEIGNESLKFVLKIQKNSSKVNQYSSTSNLNTSSLSSGIFPASSTNSNATTSFGLLSEPVARLSSHAAPPSKSKSMHSRMFSDSTHRLNSSTNNASSGSRKRSNNSADGTNKKRSKDFLSLSKNVSSNNLVNPISNISNKSSKRGAVTTIHGNSLLTSSSTISTGSQLNTSNYLSNSSLNDTATFSQVSFFPGLRNFKIPKVVETANETSLISTNNSTDFFSQSSLPSKQDSISSQNSTNISNQISLPTTRAEVISNNTSTSRLTYKGVNESTDLNSINIQHQLQRKPNKSILKNTLFYNNSITNESNSRSKNNLHSTGSGNFRSHGNSTNKNRKTLLPNQNIRSQNNLQSRQLSNNNFIRCDKNWQGSSRLGQIDWAPAFSHHQQMVSHQTQSSSASFHNSLTNSSSNSSNYGSSSLFSQLNQNNLNINELQNISQKPEQNNDPLSPVEGLLIAEDE